MKHRLCFFPYSAINYKAAQDRLDRMADRGWRLKHIYLSTFALFEPAESPHHYVDLDINHNDFNEPDGEYLQLCTDGGWEYLQSLRGMLFFRSLPGTAPVPIQSDTEIEWEQFWKKYHPKPWETILLLAGLLLVAFLFVIPSYRYTTTALALNSSLLYLIFILLALLLSPLSLIQSRWYLARCRKANRVERPGRLAPILDGVDQLQKIFLYLILLCTIAESLGAGKTVDLALSDFSEEKTATVEACQEWPVIMATDLGLRGETSSRYLDGHRSLLCSALLYSELLSGDGPDSPFYRLTTERYECINEPLAKLALYSRKKETEATKSDFLWGPLPWIPVEGLGFEESYTCRDNSYLLLRQGNVIALVGCSDFDLTSPEVLSTIQSRIFS